MRSMSKPCAVPHQSVMVFSVLLRLLLGLAIASTPASAATLTINPVCGVAGSSVTIAGSGWGEVGPPCDYLFLFDGAVFAPSQPDSLFGPPNRTTTIPAGATLGEHKIRVELRVTSTNELRQCLQDTFKVVDSTQDPFAGGNNVKVGGAPTYGPGNILIDFDPTNACAVSKCTKIRAIQAIQQTGKTLGPISTIRNLTFTEQTFAPANVYNDASITLAGWTIDSGSGAQPYYSPPFAGHSGEQSKTPKVSQLIDRPRRSAPTFPPDIDEVILNFETNFFCAEGENRGEFVGQVTWTWQKTRASLSTSGVSGQITMHSNGTNAQPSPAFFDALTLYNANNNYLFPTIAPKQLPPGQGGKPCN